MIGIAYVKTEKKCETTISNVRGTSELEDEDVITFQQAFHR